MAHIGIAGDHAGPSCSAWVASLHDITMRIYSKEAQDGILQAIFKLVQATNKQAHEALIASAVQLVDKHCVPLRVDQWSLFAHEAIREADGTHFFAPGKLSVARGDDDLDAVE